MHVFLFWFEGFFLARGYPQKVNSEQIAKVFFSKESFLKGISEQGMSFVATYPKLKDSGKLIKSLQLFLYCNCEVQRRFSPAPIVSYWSARKIKDYIVWSKLYPIERKVESSGCGSLKCQVCASIQLTDTFSSLVTKSAYKINHNFNCNIKCFI